ncbi:uncharacterized protein [Apostichopus japonicus]|uniref:uncharacterized protein n=1 Tax=Stichopus japonicus TaxID=307972 RepID=UPI003AB58D13
MDRTTTKVRIVYDASAKDRDLCLNDVINNGPKLQNDLCDVLLRFRRDKVAVVCDISEMYLQIEIDEVDRPMFRFMWRDLDVQKEPGTYEFNRLIFGLNVSPFIAQKVSQENAKRYKEQFPRAAETVLTSTYMDDSMDSVEDEDVAIQLYRELTELWAKAGMSARKWLSNSKKVLEAIPVEHRAKEIKITDSEWPSIKALGLTWLAESDVFVFKGPDRSLEKMTKRNILSQLASLFDPLGFLSPIITTGKIMLQEIWSSGVRWDEEIPQELASKVKAWVSDLQNLDKVVVPRCIEYESGKTSIHVFTDASKDAYAAVAYARSETNSGVTVRLIPSKTKVAPLKALSISKLELMGAMLGLKLAGSISSVLCYRLEDVVFWVDSQNVLYWIRGRSKLFKPFVANRVGEIQHLTNPAQWRHVPGKDNPADLASRGTTVVKMIEHEKWSSGPEFLYGDPTCWPVNTVNDVVGSDQRKVVVSMMNRKVVVPTFDEWKLNPCRFSSWERMRRVTAYVFRFINNCRSKSEDRSKGKVLKLDEIQDAENYLVCVAQEDAFSRDIENIKKGGAVGSNSALKSLLPKIDDDGLLRMTSRLSVVETLPYDVRFPVILPRKHALTRLIVRKYHTDGNHVQGTNYILSKISEKYWVVHGREEIRECDTNCNQCKLRSVKGGEQVMAPLPKRKATVTLRAFSKVAVDYAGPFLTIQGRGRVRTKRYLCLFTCLSTRAVHLEIAYGLDTDTFLNAFYRFVTAGQMRWHFLPQLSPHFGGAHEALIKTSKRAIQAVLGDADVTDEELHSAFVGAEGIINSRPLTYVSASPKDMTPLTPNHFLHGSMGGVFASEEIVDGTKYSPRRRWRRVQELMRHFWQRWLREWLPSLNRRKKWHKEKVDLKVDDLVLVMEKDVVRGQWPLGRIKEVFPGPDGHIRVVKIKTSRGEVIRNITKVCHLELCD